VECRLAGKVDVMHCADDAARRIEDDIEIDHSQRHALVNDSQQHEDVRDEDGCEKLEKILDPEVDDPKTPEVCSCEMLSGMGQEANAVEGGDRQG